MKLHSDSFSDGGTIPDRCAFGKPHPTDHFTFSDNVSPHLAWSGAPDGAKSFALLCHDPDVPSVGDDVNQEGRTVPHDLPRVDFFHWVLVDIPAGVTELAEGLQSGVVPRGKDPGPGPVGRQGLNDYTGWFDGHDQMGGDYAGYDGPGPPWNDERLHHYHFTVYALDVPALDLGESFTGQQVRDALDEHVLAKASVHGTYAINPALRD